MAPRLPACCWRQHLPSSSSLRSSSQPLVSSVQRTSFFSTTSAPQVKYGWSTLPKRARPTRFNQVTSGLPAPTTGPAAALKRREQSTPVRAGVLAIKKGMTAFMGFTGTRIPCTVLQLDRVQTVLNKTRESHGYWAVQVGFGERNPGNVGAPMLGYYEAKGIPPKQKLAEFRVRDEKGLLPIGVQLLPDWFYIGQRVDVRSNSRGQGFAGGMKRHGFSGQEASHGNSKNHRTIGSNGPSQGGGSRVLPGKKMPGRMGNERVTVQNLPILMIDNELGIVVVKGAVAGPKGCVVKIQDACKKPPPPPEHIEKTLKQLKERFPEAEKHLQAAREKHLELKEARRQKRIEEMLGKSWEPTKEQTEMVKRALAMEEGAGQGEITV
ncbi:putative mitochondrial LSU ribosomal protein L9 precursor [Podospora australis]|uniref:Large ribosomal subunit protein uL3m n=1 Tax=Podospora australis TaxID=1536484 RepID=A0AAN7AKF5_9PEZI|nr:putative mitochondrial LSU ribosomal protein L9 precursor [Podospora australis]